MRELTARLAAARQRFRKLAVSRTGTVSLQEKTAAALFTGSFTGGLASLFHVGPGKGWDMGIRNWLKSLKRAFKRRRTVTALLGAGAVLDLGAPSTPTLTNAVRAAQQHLPQRTPTAFIAAVHAALQQIAPPGVSCTFEDVLHAIEMLESFYWGQQQQSAWEYRPAICAFNPTLNRQFLDLPLLLAAGTDLIETIGRQVIAFDQTWSTPANAWFSDFWTMVLKRCPWDLLTTNYDSSIENALSGIPLVDGFELLDPGVYRFNPNVLINAGGSRVMHLHGSVHFGYPNFANPNRFIYQDHFEDLYRFDDPIAAIGTWSGRSANHAQSHEVAHAGPIVTGLRKTDKTLHYPYDTYQVAFHEAIRSSPRLFVAGYSFGDFHINRLLERMTRLHGNRRKIVLITYFPQSQQHWHSDPGIMDWPDHSTFTFICNAFKETNPFRMQFQSPLTSRDGCARMYLLGMREALEHHGPEIAHFLCS